MKRLTLTLGALALAMTAATGAQGALLSDLLAGDSITAGDKVFDQWRLIYENHSDLTAPLVNAAQIEVTALNDGGRDPGPGLRFDVHNGELDVTGDGDYRFIDYMFGFRVTSLGSPIKDNSLRLTDAATVNGLDNLGAFIQEFVGTDPTLVEEPGNIDLPDLAVKEVELSWMLGGGLIFDRYDRVDFPPQSRIYVSKDLLVWATDPLETASLRGFEQRFSQVPVPGTALILCWGLLVGLLRGGRG